MNSLPPSLHISLCRQLTQCSRRNLLRQQPRWLSTSHTPRAAASTAKTATRESVRYSTKTARDQHVQHKRSMAISAAGLVACAIAMYGAVTYYFPSGLDAETNPNDKQDKAKNGGTIKLEGPAGAGMNESSTVIIDGIEQVPTGNSTIPNFPKTIRLPKTIDTGNPDVRIGDELPISDNVNDKTADEYQLLGLGLRTVSFLSIQVYVVGLYIATADIPALQARLIQHGANPIVPGAAPTDAGPAATSLVPHEREALQTSLLEAEKGEQIMDHILRQGGIRTVFRIVPTRNTDFLHLRDGWVRAITARAQKANSRVKQLAGGEKSDTPVNTEFEDDSFGASLAEFKKLLGGGVRKNVPKGQTLLLLRDKLGGLGMMYQPGETKPMTWLGRVGDERIGRLVWLNYLAGKTVASESARKNIIDGMMGIVGRPIGTVEMKVV
ncbi:Altered inheritance of mitochondria protein 18 mitochondrial [Microsporum audouinii]